MIERSCEAWKGIAPAVLAEAGATIDERGTVYLPYLTPAGELYARRVVTSDGRRFWQPGDGRRPILFGLERLSAEARSRALLLAEGESDALSLRQAFAGVAGPEGLEGYDVLGVPGTSCWQAAWAEQLRAFARVYVLGDGDQAGHRFAWRVKHDAPQARVVELPAGADARALLQAQGPQALAVLLARADHDARLAEALTRGGSLEEAAAIARGEALPPAEHESEGDEPEWIGPEPPAKEWIGAEPPEPARRAL